MRASYSVFNIGYLLVSLLRKEAPDIDKIPKLNICCTLKLFGNMYNYEHENNGANRKIDR